MAISAPDYTTSRRWRDPAPLPVTLGEYGAWTPFTWDHDGTAQHGVVLVPEAAPWRRLVAGLDLAEASDAPLDLFQEADALVGVCWRYGSYVHLLTFGELYPPLRGDPGLSRIGDMEMMRIQIEASAALADCLHLRREDPRRYYRRLRAALELLPMPWRRTHDRWDAQALDEAAERFAAVADAPQELSLGSLRASGHLLPEGDPDRVEANALINGAYRNASGIEALHAGTWDPATEVPGYLRLYASDVECIASRFANSLAVELALRERLKPEARPAINAIRAPRTWTTTHETAIVAFSGLAGGPPLDERLSILASRYPMAYGTRRVEGAYDGHYERFTPAEGTVIAPSVLTDGTALFHAAYPRS